MDSRHNPNARNLRLALAGASILAPLALTFASQRAAPVAGSAAASAPAQSATGAQCSQLWGRSGEKYDERGRLPDFSFAGYRSGEVAIPDVPAKINVRDFGARGDGQADDTDAFKRAIAAASGGAILVPAGRYKITDILYIRKSNLVLRGEGASKSVLVFPKPLDALKPNLGATTTGEATSNYSWSGGLIWIEGKQSGSEIGLVAQKSERGSHEITLQAPAKIQPGQRIEITQQDPNDNSLLDYLYAGQSDNVSQIKGARITFVSRVTKVNGAKITLERPLRTDVSPLWKAAARVFEPTVTQVGIEDLGFEFPSGKYLGHFKEVGFNPLTFVGAADCWARRLRFVDADSGPFVAASFVTLEDLTFEAAREPDKLGNQGHHGVTLGTDCLLRRFDFRTKFVHDITVERSAGNVVSSGRGVDLCFDNHKKFPHANLFTNLDLGAGTRMYASGGGANLGRHAAAWTTFWNIRARKPQRWPTANWGPDRMNLIGVQSSDAPILDATGRWFEPIAPKQLQPTDLYQAQLARRLKNKRS
jgi:hypothetical protein